MFHLYTVMCEVSNVIKPTNNHGRERQVNFVKCTWVLVICSKMVMGSKRYQPSEWEGLVMTFISM